MTRLLIGAAFAATILAPAAASAQAGQVLIVDTDRVLSECTACRAANTQMQTQLTQTQQRAQQLSGTLQTQGQSIQTAVNALNGKQPDSALDARIKAFEQQRNSAAQELQASEDRLRSTQANVQRQIYAKLGPIISNVMRQHNASLVLAKNATLASVDSLEVTNDVLTQLNSQLPSVSVTPLPQQQAPAAPAAQPNRAPTGR